MNRSYSQFSEKILAKLVDGRPILHDHFGKPKRENGGGKGFRRYHLNQVIEPCGSNGNEKRFHRPNGIIVLWWTPFSRNSTVPASNWRIPGRNLKPRDQGVELVKRENPRNKNTAVDLLLNRNIKEYGASVLSAALQGSTSTLSGRFLLQVGEWWL